ncbi:hypothetical protein L7F22_011607 [Adiantum nelumboides]|nr:hypothetical protein [Adiantum nelumboides]
MSSAGGEAASTKMGNNNRGASQHGGADDGHYRRERLGWNWMLDHGRDLNDSMLSFDMATAARGRLRRCGASLINLELMFAYLENTRPQSQQWLLVPQVFRWALQSNWMPKL